MIVVTKLANCIIKSRLTIKKPKLEDINYKKVKDRENLTSYEEVFDALAQCETRKILDLGKPPHLPARIFIVLRQIGLQISPVIMVNGRLNTATWPLRN